VAFDTRQRFEILGVEMSKNSICQCWAYQPFGENRDLADRRQITDLEHLKGTSDRSRKKVSKIDLARHRIVSTLRVFVSAAFGETDGKHNFGSFV